MSGLCQVCEKYGSDYAMHFDRDGEEVLEFVHRKCVTLEMLVDVWCRERRGDPFESVKAVDADPRRQWLLKRKGRLYGPIATFGGVRDALLSAVGSEHQSAMEKRRADFEHGRSCDGAPKPEDMLNEFELDCVYAI